MLAEDALKHIHQGDLDGRHATVASLAGALQISMDAAAELLAQLQTDGMVEMHGGDIALTPQGRDTALHIVRAHRLWERHLADETGYDAAEWHTRAESAEHASRRKKSTNSLPVSAIPPTTRTATRFPAHAAPLSPTTACR